jgi:hypothetical protein
VTSLRLDQRTRATGVFLLVQTELEMVALEALLLECV